jgi:hypothetical protein
VTEASILYRRAAAAVREVGKKRLTRGFVLIRVGLSGGAGIVKSSPWSKPAGAALFTISADITRSDRPLGKFRVGVLVISRNAIAVAPDGTACTRRPLPASSWRSEQLSRREGGSAAGREVLLKWNGSTDGARAN